MAKKKIVTEKIPDETLIPETSKKEFEGHLVITKSDDPRAKWFVVHTYSGQEVRVSANLRQRVETMNLGDRILEVLIPTHQQIQIKSGKKKEITEKIFPGYVLVRMILDDNSWLAVRTTQGVTGFVGIGNKPTPISDAEVATIQKYMNLEAPKYKSGFSVGEAVKIVDGPFSDVLGTIQSMDEARGRLEVLVSIFGRETPVELDFLQVKKV